MTRPQKNTPARRSLKTKGLSTRAAILDSAREVFRDLGYYQTSVSEITRRCGVSTGTFYQYFKNKEQIFLELNDLIISRFWEQAEGLPPGAQKPGGTPDPGRSAPLRSHFKSLLFPPHTG